MDKQHIHVTQPYLPPLDEFVPYLAEIWENRILTNGGPFHQQLEAALCAYLDVKHIALFSSGTTALMTALRALRIQGEVITTPFSFVATAHALLWNDLTPVFADVDPQTLNLDPVQVEAAITPRTTAILPVHCYGRPCQIEAIREIAEAYQLHVIYDAAHAFGVRDAQGSVLRHGDLSVLSFHATKVFNTFEGGAIVCPDLETKQQIDRLKNFGIVDEETVATLGLNGKMSEINAAFGLLQLQYIDQVMACRRQLDSAYREGLANVRGIECLGYTHEISANYSYFPILVKPEYPLSRDALQQRLKDCGIYSRRYFYPLISDTHIYRDLPSAWAGNLPVAKAAADQVLCLPIYPALTLADVERIVALIQEEKHSAAATEQHDSKAASPLAVEKGAGRQYV